MMSITFLERVSKMSVYLLAFLIPLWMLPFSQNVLDYQKQALLLVLVFLGLSSALALIVNKGEVMFRKSITSLLVIPVILAVGLSTLFSLWRYGSFWGWPLHASDNFLAIFGFAILYFLILHHTQSLKNLVSVYFLLVASAAGAAVFGMAQLYGIFLLPFSFAKQMAFNTIGTPNNLVLFIAALLPLAIVLAFLSRTLLRWILWLLVGVFFAMLAIVNLFEAWVVLIAGLLVLLAFGMWNVKKRAEFGWVSLPMAFLVVAMFFVVFRVALPGSPAGPVEVRPSMAAEAGILNQVLQERALLGSGPGTFVFEYTKFRPSALNQTIFWGTRFGSGSSEIMDWIVTKGLLGMLSLALLICATLFFAVKRLINPSGEGSENFSWMVGLGTLASFVALLCSFFLYPASFTMWFLFWVLLAGLGILIGKEVKTLSVAPPSFLALVSSFVFLIVLIFGLGLLFLGGQKYIAEIQYARASQQKDVGQAIQRILSAIRLNPASDLYWRDISQLYLSQLSTVSQNTSLSADEKQKSLQAVVNNAVAAARQATAIAPANVANWNVQGSIYQNLIGVQGVEDLAVQAYQKAGELDPSSPFSITELARVYVLQAQSLAAKQGFQQQRSDLLQKALDQLNKAVGLKSDYSPANYLIAVAYDAQGKSEEAARKLEELKVQNPNDVGLAFQLGMVHWQKGDVSRAQEEFLRAKILNPKYANALYMLGLTYDKQGNKEKAKGEFQSILDLNPDNEDIKRIIANLNSGKPALEGLTPAQPPVQEQTPPEIKKEK